MKHTSLFDQRAKERDSGIELLKLVAIILIVTSHVVQTLSSPNLRIPYQEYVLPISTATTDPKMLVLVLCRYFGVWGNSLFFVCSAWFLHGSTRVDKKKAFSILIEVWVISVIILVATYIILHGEIAPGMILKSLLPTSTSNNWYITCYLLFYAIHPLLNYVIDKLSQQSLLRTVAVLVVLYFGFNFLKGGMFFANEMIIWIALYFLMAYLQLFAPTFMNSIPGNVRVLAIGLIGYVGTVLLTDVLGLHFSFFSNQLLRWASNGNPFLIATSIAMFNLARSLTFKSRVINYLSSLSLLIYIIHDNLILRTYFRPAMWQFIFVNYGYEHILMWVFVMALVIMAFGLVSAIVYDKTLRRLVYPASNGIYGLFRRLWKKAETYLLRIR